jgi:hypothetical protein
MKTEIIKTPEMATRLVKIAKYQDNIKILFDSQKSKLKSENSITLCYNDSTNAVSLKKDKEQLTLGHLSSAASRYLNNATYEGIRVDWVKKISFGGEKLLEVGVILGEILNVEQKEAIQMKQTGFKPNFEFSMVGVTFKNKDGVKCQEILEKASKLITATETVSCSFEREPDNAVDPYAVVIKVGNSKIGKGYIESSAGYVPKEIAPLICEILDSKEHFQAAPLWIAKKEGTKIFGCRIAIQVEGARAGKLKTLIKQA